MSCPILSSFYLYNIAVRNGQTGTKWSMESFCWHNLYAVFDLCFFYVCLYIADSGFLRLLLTPLFSYWLVTTKSILAFLILCAFHPCRFFQAFSIGLIFVLLASLFMLFFLNRFIFHAYSSSLRSSWLANLLISLLTKYFLFCFSCVFTNCNIQSLVVYEYFINLFEAVFSLILVGLIFSHFIPLDVETF